MVVPRRIGRGRSAARPPPRASTESEGEAEDDETAKRVDAASAVLDAIIRETVQGIFVEEAATEVLNEASEAEHRETPAETVDKRAVLRSVVQSHFEELLLLLLVVVVAGRVRLYLADVSGKTV